MILDNPRCSDKRTKNNLKRLEDLTQLALATAFYGYNDRSTDLLKYEIFSKGDYWVIRKKIFMTDHVREKQYYIPKECIDEWQIEFIRQIIRGVKIIVKAILELYKGEYLEQRS